MTHHNSHSASLPLQAVSAAPVRNRQRRGTSRRGVLPTLLVVGLASVVSLQGCAKHSKNHFVVGSVPNNYKERHPIVLEEQEQTLDVPVATSSYGLAAPAASAVKGFTQSYKTSASGAISVMLPAGSPNEAAARTIGRKIVDVIRDSGVPSQRISMVTYNASEHGTNAPIRLSYGAIQASVGQCGKWTKDLTVTSENRNYENFGCASQNNLAAIVSNPADLLGPRGTTGIDAARRGKVIEDYRTAVEPNTPSDSYSKIPSTFTLGVE